MLSDDYLDFSSYLDKEFLDGQVMHKCLICGRSSSDRGNMHKHVENIHFPNRFSYACKYCDHSFGTRKKMYYHIQTKHKNDRS